MRGGAGARWMWRRFVSNAYEPDNTLVFYGEQVEGNRAEAYAVNCPALFSDGEIWCGVRRTADGRFEWWVLDGAFDRKGVADGFAGAFENLPALLVEPAYAENHSPTPLGDDSPEPLGPDDVRVGGPGPGPWRT